jgi:arylsulfatase A-like enzyme
MVSHLDEQIGRLINHLKNTGQFENTVIFFSSDNGPAYQGSPGPFKGGKTDLHEGGIRVPAFWVWKEQIQENSHSFETGHFADVFPTICEIAGINITKSNLDGKSILPVLTKGENLNERTLLWQMDLYKHYQNQGEKPKPYSTTVAMHGKWKMLADSLVPVELFNISQDHREIYNLLGDEKEIEDQLQLQISEFLSEPRLDFLLSHKKD